MFVNIAIWSTFCSTKWQLSYCRLYNFFSENSCSAFTFLVLPVLIWKWHNWILLTSIIHTFMFLTDWGPLSPFYPSLNLKVPLWTGWVLVLNKYHKLLHEIVFFSLKCPYLRVHSMYSLNQNDCAEMGNPHPSSYQECPHSAALQYENFFCCPT